MKLAELQSIEKDSFDVVSTDIFDTVLLRDFSLQRERFHEVATAIAKEMQSPDGKYKANAIYSLRCALHQFSYKAVAIENPEGDFALADIYHALCRLVGESDETMHLMKRCELRTDISHLSCNQPLIDFLWEMKASGKRVIATSDTYYSATDISYMLSKIVGNHPIDRIYSSSDLNKTKQHGGIFSEVAKLENIEPSRLLHIGDNRHSDADMPTAYKCKAVYLPRTRLIRLIRTLRRAIYGISAFRELLNV